jgi:pseudoazurin
VGLASAAALIWRHPLADVAAEAASPVGAVFTLLALASGSLWGQPMWSIYWAWDARLNSFLLLFFLYVGQLALLNVFDVPAGTNRLRDSPAIYRRRKQGDGRVPEPFDTQPKTRKKDSIMLKKLPLLAAATGLVATLALTAPAMATEHIVKMRNSGEAGVMVFEPAYLQVEPGDTVTFEPTDKGHNAETIPGMIPDGAEAFKGKVSQAISVTFETDGVYGYKCLPHYAIGMVGVVVVGDPAANVEAAKAVKQPGKASKVMAELLARAETNLSSAN